MRDLYQLITATVCRVTGFNEMQIIHDRHQLCTDARYLLVHLMSEQMPCHQIARYTGLSKQCVSQCANRYSDRAKYNRSLQLTEQEIKALLKAEGL